MGMLNGFISGFAGAGANILAQRSLEDYRNEADLMKAQRIQDMADARAERLRSESTGRVSGYFAPTTESVAGAATAFDDDGNPTAANDFKVSRETTLGEAIKKSQKAGDLQSAVVMQGMLAKDDATEIARTKAENYLKNIESRDATKLEISENKEATRMALAFDELGNPIVRGGGAAGAALGAKLNFATQQVKILQRDKEHADKMYSDITLDSATRAEYKKQRDAINLEYKAAQKTVKEVGETAMGLIAKSETGNSESGGKSGAPSGVLSPQNSPAENAKLFAGRVNDAAASLDKQKTATVTPAPTKAADVPVAKSSTVADIAKSAATAPAGMLAAPVEPSPIERVGSQLDAAKSDLNAIRSIRAPGLRDGREAIQKYQESLTAAKLKVEILQNQYEDMVTPTVINTRPAIMGRRA